MTIQSMLGGITSQPSSFVAKLMAATKPRDVPPQLAQWASQMAMACVELLSRQTSTTMALESSLRTLNVLVVQLTGLKSELRERLMFEMATRKRRHSQPREDGSVEVMDTDNGRKRVYPRLSDVLAECETDTHLSKKMVLEFHVGNIVLTSDFRFGRVISQSAMTDSYTVDVGNGIHRTYSARDLVNLTDDLGQPISM